MDGGEWQQVSAKSKHSFKNNANKKQNSNVASLSSTELSVDSISEDFKLCYNVFKETRYCSHLKSCVKQLHDHTEKFNNLLALGIGNFSSSPTSMLQLVAFVVIVDLLVNNYEVERFSTTVNAIDSDNRNVSKMIFDPLMTKTEMEFCRIINLDAMTSNSKGNYSFTDRTLYYTPHCPYRLYCNILWSNWSLDAVKKIVIIGNSFESYSLRRIEAPSTTDSVKLITEYMKEINLWPRGLLDSFLKDSQTSRALAQIENAFCDLSIMSLDEKELNNEIPQNLLALFRTMPTKKELEQATLADVEVF